MLVTAALLIAMQIILSRFLSINAWNLKIGFAFTAVFVAAYLYGPWFSAVVALIADIVGASLFPSGAFFPGFTVTAVLSGLVFGVFLYKKQSPGRIIAAVAIDQLILGLLLNSYWLSILYGSPYLPLLATRAIQCLVMMPVMYLTISALSKMLAGSKRRLVS
ncbi:MAG: folate family ECF transporter S component [Firmicutes bacterium]|nr:folate family ECF transporter S component [Bacillota bacterium]